LDNIFQFLALVRGVEVGWLDNVRDIILAVFFPIYEFFWLVWDNEVGFKISMDTPKLTNA
jgi:hypothetical protein